MNLLTFVMSLLFSVSAYCGTPEVLQAIQSGNAENLSKYLDETVEVCINNNQEIYSKQNAILAVQGFFKNNKPISIKEAHQGESRNNAGKYTIANLSTSGGNYRVYIFFKNTASKSVIQEIRFDK